MPVKRSLNYKSSYQRNNYKRAGIKDVDKAIELINSATSCSLCGAEEKRLCLDHDHVSGKIRGVLCYHCNQAIGLFQDNSSSMRKAADYIDKFSKELYN